MAEAEVSMAEVPAVLTVAEVTGKCKEARKAYKVFDTIFDRERRS
jgi:hypothetical protein